MTARRRLLRMLLIVGLVPSVAAAGLPRSSCGCANGVHAVAACGCCGSPAGECRCGMGDGNGSSCCGGLESAPSDDAPAVGCRCGGPAPAPAVPTPPPVELAAPAVLPAAVAAYPAVRPTVPAAAERVRSARLPSADLTTVLCTLLI